MPYATAADMTARFGEQRLRQLTDLSEPLADALVGSTLQTRLDDADAEIDGYLAGRYALPITPVPAVLRTYACDIAWYRLLGASATESDLARYTAAISYLKLVAKGDVSLMPPAESPAPVGLGPVLFEPGQKVMGREAA
jgi:phage gp36-like protein